MGTVRNYLLRCLTENANVTGWSLTTPTCCFNNNEHEIDNDSISIIGEIKQSQDSLIATNEDNRQIVAICALPRWQYMYYTCEGDDFNSGVRGGGGKFQLTIDEENPSSVTTEFQFIEPVNIVGGFLLSDSNNIHDHVSMGVYAPATVVTANNSNTGNCTLYPYGPGYVIIPVSGVGNYDVDLTTPINQYLDGTQGVAFVSKSVPVPAHNIDYSGFNGYWDWNRFTGAITPNSLGTGKYHLLTFDVDLVKFVHKWYVWSADHCYSHTFQIMNKGQEACPQWKWKAVIYRDPSHYAGNEQISKITLSPSENNTDAVSGKIVVYYNEQMCCQIKFGTTAVAAKSKIETAVPFVAAGGVTAVVSAAIGVAAGSNIVITFTEIGDRHPIKVVSTLSDGTDDIIANVTDISVGLDKDPAVHFSYGFYLGRTETPAIE